MKTREYIFDYLTTYHTKYETIRVRQLGYIKILLSSPNIIDNMVDGIIKHHSEAIKRKIKEEHSIQKYGRSCYEKPKWYQSKIIPISINNIRPYQNNSPIKNDRLIADLIVNYIISSRDIE